MLWEHLLSHDLIIHVIMYNFVLMLNLSNLEIVLHAGQAINYANLTPSPPPHFVW